MSTRLCTDPYAIIPISINECVGLSLNTINAYYDLVLEDTCLQSDEVQQITNDLVSLSADTYALSAEITSFPKAFVSFSGNLSTVANTLEIFNSYNVNEVAIRSAGVYDIIFSTNFPNTTSFGAIATCSSVKNTGGGGFGRAVIETGGLSVSSIRVRIENTDGLVIDKPAVVAVTVFGNK